MKAAFFAISLLAVAAQAKLLIDFTGGDPVSKLGIPELEGQNLGDTISASQGGNNVFIRTANDTVTGRKALHYHRDPHFRRAEVRALEGQFQINKTYFIGYTVRLTRQHDSLVLFQWKRNNKDAAPADNYPFNLEFDGGKLTMQYTTPGGSGSNRKTVWSGPFSVGNSTADVHHIGLTVNTANDGTGFLEFYLDGKKQKFTNGTTRLSKVFLLNGPCKAKFGIYRGEAAAGSKDAASLHTFDSYVYRVQISDSSLSEVSAAAGL